MPFNDEVVECIYSAMNSHVNNRFNQFLFRYISYYRSKVHNNSTNNMTQFCIDNILYDTSFIDDFGCFSTPFASVTLQHILDSSTKLVPPEVRTLILASDDEAWMISEIEAMY